WFRLYWSVFALLLVVLSYSLWRRGADTRLLPRLKALPRKLQGTAGVLALGSLLVFCALGGWIYYNTNVLNVYRSTIAGQQLQADAERALMRFQHTPQPKITDVTLRVDLYPHQHRATAEGVYQIENKTGAPLTEVHLAWPQLLQLDRVEVDGA